ncbi:sugar-binding protein [Ruminococcus sp.]|uniref:substrate-binding domain-containing protein n=1 Tax=Ruminococcus sp. TaxID=41978 RepID=UPI0025D61704|nr:sugar-binding protein [Ruminococcus sp.]MBQ6252162.1 sugar-binding protein [Ruminococcus sp.]
MKKFFAAAMAAIMMGSLVSCGKDQADKGEAEKKKIGIAMPAEELERWNSDGLYLKQQFEEAGYDVILKYSQNDASKQNNDVLGMISEDVDLLLIAAVDGNQMSKTLDDAKAKNIPIVAYDRLIMNTDAITYYVSFDNYTVGKMQAEFVRDELQLDSTSGPYNIEFVAGDKGDNNARYFFNGAYETLEPYIKSGKLEIPSGKNTFERVATDGWTTDNAEKDMKGTLSVNYKDKNLDVVLCSNDSTALGVTKALESGYKGSGQPIITGQDGDIENLRNIVDGKQSMTVYKNVSDEAGVALEVCKKLLDGEIPAANLTESFECECVFDSESYNNGVKYVQSYLLVPYVITKDNLQLLVNTGLYRWDASNKYLELNK